MHTSLTALASEFDAAALWAKRLADQYPAAVWTPRPASGGWPAVDCLAHLNVTAAAFWPGLERAWQAVQAMPSAGEPFRLSLLERLLLWFIEPPYRQKIKTPPAFEPTTQPPRSLPSRCARNFKITRLVWRRLSCRWKGLRWTGRDWCRRSIPASTTPSGPV